MLKVPAFIEVSRRMIRLVDGPWWMVPSFLLLNVLAFLSEGVGIYFLMPLMSVLIRRQGEDMELGVGGQGAVVGMINRVADWFAGPYQVPILIFLIVSLLLARAVFLVASNAAFSYAGGRIGYVVRTRTLTRLLKAPQSFIDSQPPGRLLNILATEAIRVADGMRFVAGLVGAAIGMGIFFVLMLLVSSTMTAIVAGGMAAILVFVYFVTSGARRVGEKFVAANTVMSARISETLGGLWTILLFNRDREEFARFEAAARRVWRERFILSLWESAPPPLTLVLTASFIGALIVALGAEWLTTLIVFLVLLQRMQPMANRFMTFRINLIGLSGSLDQIEEFLADRAATPLPDGDKPAPAPRRAIRLEQVRYRYLDGERDALSDLTLEIPVGKTTALVGHSGAGKSTVLSLICRHFDPDAGAVLVDGVSLREFDLRSWRSRIAVVPQDVFLFDDTIRANVGFGKQDATDAQIIEAIKIAGASEFISQLTDGLDTRVGDRGSQLSGGQRQRIALARAVIANPDVLILDEATNALDNLSARLVQDAIQRASAGRTILVVAHRLAPVRNADHVIVLDGGRAIESGSPDKLLRTDGAFSRLVAAEEVVA